MVVAVASLVGTCIVGLGALLHVVGMTTTQWMKAPRHDGVEIHVGLFEQCVADDCSDLTHLTSQEKAVQALAILGILAGGLGLIVTTVFVILTHVGRHPISLMRIAAGLLCMAAGGFILVCVIVYGAKIYRDEKNYNYDVSLGYSFELSTGGCFLLLVGGGIIVAKRASQEERYTS